MVHQIYCSRLHTLMVLFGLFIYCNSYTQQNDYFLTQMNGWSIYSPTLSKISSKKILSPHTQEYLVHLGKQADFLWQGIPNKTDLIVPFADLFESVDRNFLSDLIDQILSDDELFEKVRLASYHNVTGFLKIVLAEGGPEGWKIRLHVWEQNEQKEFPHNHKWDFYSKIITGYLSQDIYEVTDNIDEGVMHSLREPVSLMPVLNDGALPCPCRDDYTLEEKQCDLSAVLLCKASSNIIGIGESYFMPNHLIHTITPGTGAISCVFTSAKKVENSEVFVPMGRVNTDLKRNAPSVTDQELREELLRVKKMLNQLQIQTAYLPELVDNQHHYFSSTEISKMCQNWRSSLMMDTKDQYVVQLTELEKHHYKIAIDSDGKVLIGNQSVDPSQEYIFVLQNDLMYAAPKDFHHIKQALLCHTSFTDYGPVESVGVLHFNKNCKVSLIEAYSGHYAPTVSHMSTALKYLKSMNIAAEDVSCIAYYNREGSN